MMAGYRYILSGGGTSGHVNPALAIAEAIRQADPEANICFYGTQRGIEADLVTRAGYAFRAIEARPLPGRPSPAMLQAVWSFWKGRRQCRQLMRQFRPHIVIGTGGYVCSPVVSAAASLDIPVLLHEQNAFPGRSNRLMARLSQLVCVAFPGTERHFTRRVPVVVTGNPVRPVFFSQDQQAVRQRLHPAGERPLVLAMGGSLGARTINQAVLGLADWIHDLEQQGRPIPRIVLAAGQRQYASIAGDAAAEGRWLEVHDYIHNIQEWMAAADLLICRAGALTCSEIAALGRPAILVPYPYAAGDHQTFNARVLADAGAALLCPDAQLTGTWLAAQLEQLLGRSEQLASMGRQAASLARPDAATVICQHVMRLIKP
ncbi:MAG: undecaprenyldiphospho-muramoylpentapeptide beta-N-acetylglucosaminyltransferase [Clostridiaceae bacterium]|nr:undecaprenyldiphospho-muramoylpentapeptide beta-N-acetylglucosaminyltransferase [Clostridiaceae bacterium]